jgi:hypothetical protein
MSRVARYYAITVHIYRYIFSEISAMLISELTTELFQWYSYQADLLLPMSHSFIHNRYTYFLTYVVMGNIMLTLSYLSQYVNILPHRGIVS